MQAIMIEKTGDVNVLKIKKVDDPKPKQEEILIKQTAIGVNFFDICFRRGQYPLSQTPACLGMEACGIVEAVGEGVTELKIGERVAYATGGIGAYAEKRTIHQSHVIKVPDYISDIEVAGSLFKGLVAHSLLHRVFIALGTKRILIHSCAGGVGHILSAWAKHFELEVIGTVGDDRKISFAKANGCDHVINYSNSDFLEEVKKITKNEGVGAVYDGVGKTTLRKSIQCLWPMGICVSFGDASGTPEPLNIDELTAKSLSLCRPLMPYYKSNRPELVLTANEIFSSIKKKIIRPQIKTYNFSDFARAHQALESRASIGSIVLTL